MRSFFILSLSLILTIHSAYKLTEKPNRMEVFKLNDMRTKRFGVESLDHHFLDYENEELLRFRLLEEDILKKLDSLQGKIKIFEKYLSDCQANLSASKEKATQTHQ